MTGHPDTLLNVFLAIAVDNLANAQELTKVRTGVGDEAGPPQPITCGLRAGLDMAPGFAG